MSSHTVNDQSIILLNNARRFLDGYIACIIFVLGNLTNLLSICIFSKKSWRKNVCVFYLKSFILFNSCYINSTILSSIFINGFEISLQNSNVFLCKLYQYTYFVFISLSPTVLISASIDRLLISSQNVDTRLYSSKRLAYFSLSIGTCFWMVFAIHAPIMFSVYEISSSTFFCTVITSRIYATFLTYFYGAMNVVYCLVMMILCALSFQNVRQIRAVPREKRTQQIRAMNKKDFQLLRCLFIQDLVYICLSTLFISFFVYQILTRDQLRTVWTQTLVNFISRLINMIYNMFFISSFFIFVIVSRAFRLELKRLIYKIIGREFNQIREEENRVENIPVVDVELHPVPTILLTS